MTGAPETRPGNRVVTDEEGTAWAVSEAYRYDVSNTATPLQTLALLWFETATGRTASAVVPQGSLAILTDEDLLELLRVGTDRKGRQP